MRLILLAVWLILSAGPVQPATLTLDKSDALLALATTGLPEPLIRSKPTTQTEDRDLKDALRVHRERSKVDDLSGLEAFLSAHPDTGWSPSLLLNLGLTYRHYGYVTRAETAWRAAWQRGRDAGDPEAKALVDRAVGELALLYASRGASAELEALFADIGPRPITGL